MAARRTSISRKLSLIIACSILAAALVISVTAAVIEAQRHTRARLAYVEASAALFASAVSEATAQGDRQGVLRALRAVGRAPNLTHVRVEDTTGRTIGEIGSGVRLDSDVTIDGAGRSEGVAAVAAALSSRTVRAATPIRQGGEDVGRLIVIADNADLADALQRSLMLSGLWALIATAGGLALSARLRPSILRPLAALNATVERVAQTRDYTEAAPVMSRDEIGDLCRGFNDMMGQVRARDAQIIALAHKDPETGLPNRLAFEEALTLGADRAGAGVVVAVTLSVNRFPQVRAAIGYDLAAQLMAALGARLGRAAPGATVARLSTDALGLAFPARSVERALAALDPLARRAEAPITVGGHRIDVDLTMGVAVGPFGVASAAELVRQSAIAVDQARARHARCALFDAGAYGDPAKNLSLMSDLKRALANGEAQLHLQPKACARRGAIIGAEALMRWTSPTRGFVSPDLFIGMAEETGAIADLTLWGLDQAMGFGAHLARIGPPPPIALNVSGRLIGDAEFIAEAMGRLRAQPARIAIEITETALIENPEAALANIRALGAIGVDVAIDDYGVGVSSLAYLKQIPAQELKIDKSYILPLAGVDGGGRDALLVKSTIDLAHSLDMKVTAEGVETEAVRTRLAAMGCDCVQGYLIGKAAPFAAFAARLAEAA